MSTAAAVGTAVRRARSQRALAATQVAALRRCTVTTSAMIATAVITAAGHQPA